ncbi:MFS transporter [candidate division KSB1 bacterium]|nr:MFS transporter [candidate division KSB1 bacterium]
MEHESASIPQTSDAIRVHHTDAVKVPFREKLALGVGGFSNLFAYIGINTLARTVYVMILGLNAAWIGVALTIPRIWDAFSDPIMGKISDNFHSRWGRRRPFIVGGAITMGLIFGLIWMVPQAWNETTQIIYFILMQLLFYTCYTVFAVPFKALTYEMTPDYNERNQVMAYVAFFHKLAEFLYEWLIPLAAVISSAYFVSKIPEGQQVEMTGIIIVTWLVGIIIMAGIGVIPGIFVKERFQKKTEKQEKVKLLTTSKEAFSSRAFQILVSIIILNVLAGILASNIDHFVMIYYMANGDIALGSIWKGLLSSGYAVVGFAFIPIITGIADKFGKKAALYFVYALTVFGGFMKWFIFTPGHHIYYAGSVAIDPIILIDPLLCGPMWVAVKILLESMMADICDEDELKFGKRREGVFGAVFTWLEKTALSLAALGVGFSIWLAGFNAELGGNQDPKTFLIMRLFLSGAPAITALFAIIALKYYPITAEHASETRRQLEERRGKVTL